MTQPLYDLADDLLEQARGAGNGRAAASVVGGKGHLLRMTVLALRAGEELAEHASPGEATLLVLRGAVELRSDGQVLAGAEGDLLVIPPARHGVRAEQDSALLLTVASAP
ncbi:MAG: cupin domain-containing protein [Nocardioidaceae bacterium]